MTQILIIASIVGPLLPFLLFPGRLIGRGGIWVAVGAAMLVGIMMLVFFSMQDLGSPDSAIAGLVGGDATASLSAADVAALEKLLK